MTRRVVMANQSGLVHKVLVYQNGMNIGLGYILMLPNSIRPFILTDFEGEDLQPDMYDLVYTDQSYVALFNDTVQ